jgi:predicted dehydrogenase
MRIGIIGYKNQSYKLFTVIKKTKLVKKFYFYHPNFSSLINLKKEKNIITTNILSDLYELDGVIIASPSDTHFFYLKKFINKKPYIFCEKPCFTTIKEFNELKSLNARHKKKIIFNFCLSYSPIFQIIKKYINKKKLGKMIFANINYTIGIAYKKVFKNNWRFKKNLFFNIAGNLGIHFTKIFFDFFGLPNNFYIKNKSIKKNIIDTATLLLERNSQEMRINLSYAAPYFFNMLFMFSNGYIEFSNNNLKIFYPRSSFDKKNYFITPPNKILLTRLDFSKNLHIGTIRILNYFLYAIKNKKKFNLNEFNNSLAVNKLFIKSDNNLK